MLVPPPPEPASAPYEQNNVDITESTEDTGDVNLSGNGSAGDNTGNDTSNNPDYNTSGTSEAEVEDLRKR